MKISILILNIKILSLYRSLIQYYHVITILFCVVLFRSVFTILRIKRIILKITSPSSHPMLGHENWKPRFLNDSLADSLSVLLPLLRLKRQSQPKLLLSTSLKRDGGSESTMLHRQRQSTASCRSFSSPSLQLRRYLSLSLSLSVYFKCKFPLSLTLSC
jgi:hypothetical protein